MRHYVYILHCSDGSYYIGRTSSLERRVAEHALGMGSQYTKRRRPVKLVWSAEFPSEDQAYAAEMQMKGWTRAKKEAMIVGDFDALVELSKNRQGNEPPHHPSTSSG